MSEVGLRPWEEGGKTEGADGKGVGRTRLVGFFLFFFLCFLFCFLLVFLSLLGTLRQDGWMDGWMENVCADKIPGVPA